MIGVYDSGIGGLSVWREIFYLLPEESYAYFSDARYCPYGERDTDFITGRALAISEMLIKRGCDIIAVACNTATAAAIETLRKTFDIPFIGMEPAVKPAILASKSGVVGVLATAVTFKGKKYNDTRLQYAGGNPNIRIMEQVGYGLVEAVESGRIHSPETVALLEKYILPMKEQGADHIVLGCTHYPFLAEEIARIAGPDVNIVNPAPAVARQLQRNYSPKAAAAPATIEFLSSGTFNAGVRNLLDSLCAGRSYTLTEKMEIK
ncbi:MAG: glutamate racemase [Bacteroidales bacterium]|nr:glutamate racemase [Bacteroidales bacterium]